MVTALLLVDAQRTMLEGAEAVPSAADVKPALEALLDVGRAAAAMVVLVQNDGQPGDPDEPDTEGWELVFAPTGNDVVVRKDEPDTFAANPQLADVLRQRGVERIIVAGMQSEYCIRATARGALGEGFAVVLARGAHATYGDTRSDADAVAASVEEELEAEGARIITLADIEF